MVGSVTVIHRKKSTIAKVHDLSTFFSNIHCQGHQNSVCIHYIPYLSVLKGYLEQVNH
jgi:hypothetical protein